jgi:PAS domain S-box-containing protein
VVPHSLNGPYAERGSQVLWEGEERVLRRGWRLGGGGEPCAALFVVPAAEHPSRLTLDRLRHEYELKEELNEAWAVKPLEMMHEAGRTILVLEDPGGEPLEGLLGAPIEVGRFLRLAIGIAVALGKLHQCGLVHKDIKPVNVLANDATGEVHLTGFGIASRVARERHSPYPPEMLAGTLAYMAPEQTGRMNRSVDSRSDLYALGVTFYQMLTGALPFTASEPMEWVHCHLARRPLPPAERLKKIPQALSAIIMKLLAKRAEDRYQTAAGLERDLRRCQSEWKAQSRIDEFPLGEHDTPDRLLIPEKLYGRQREVEILLGAFDRVVKGGAPELILVSGYSGIGKSSVVNELEPVLVPPRALFASGKLDQYKRDIPYSTLAQAFQSLIRSLLSKREADLAAWRETLRENLGSNAGLITGLVPELKHIIGEPPPVPELPPQDAQRRFQLTFRRFISAFAQHEHPLALFLDDLQWLDAATLDLLEDLLTHSDLKYLLLIGAYRDNEVDTTHPLMRKLEAIKIAGGTIEEIALGPLSREHISQLLADTLRCEPERSAELAQLVQEKTGGNPFFAIQFIHSLAEERMLTFDDDAAQWSWAFDRIHAKGYTDNVADLMVGRLSRLPAHTQTALQQLACLGNSAVIADLTTALETSEEQMHAALWESVRQGLVEQLNGSYKFIHDRVHEAAYSLIPEASRAEAHLRIGRLLLARASPEMREETVFDIVNHLNRGVALIDSRNERDQLAELNLIAGKRAKAATAYASALKYLVAGATLLGDDGWERRRDLKFAMELERAECEFLTSDLSAADENLTTLANRAANALELAAPASLHISVCLELLRPDRAVAVCLDYLRRAGIDISPHPTEDEVRREYAQIWSHLGGRAIEEVADLPPMTDPESRATLDVLLMTGIPAAITDENLNCWTICRAVNLSLERGNCDASCLAYAVLSRPAVQYFRDYQTAFRFGRVAVGLVEARGSKRFEARTYYWFSDLTVRWMKPLRTCFEFLRRGIDAANKIGDFTFVNATNVRLSGDLLIAGDPLSNVQRQAELGMSSVKMAQFSGDMIMLPLLALIRTLRGLTPKFGRFDYGEFEEIPFERLLAGNPYLRAHECLYLVYKIQARYFAGDYAEAMEASLKARRSISHATCQAGEGEYHFYTALCRAASCDSATVEQRRQHLEALAEHQRLLQIWAGNCPENFENRAALVGAEIARIEERDLEAMHLYEMAIRSSRTNGFVNNEALAYERASEFYRARGFNEFADTYIRNARACYVSWGADGKVKQLERLYPGLRQEQPVAGPASTITTPVEGLDLATVIQVSQAVSGEIVLEKLLDIVMRKAMEHAGAERSLLIVPKDDQLQVEAEATIIGSDAVVRLREASALGIALPESIVRYVMRTHESVILDDALSSNSFSADPYILENRARSILCLPLLNQAKLTGILYLENNLAPRVFTAERFTVLSVLASQAAISLENTRLYRDLEDREAKIRRLVDSNVVGIVMWNLNGAITGANEAFLRMMQYDHADLASGHVRWTDLTPGEWRYVDEQAIAELKASGIFQPVEKEYFRKDGNRVPVLIGGALFKGGEDEGVAFVLDLTERKRAEQALRQLESDLTHMNRLSMLGELTASLAHEVKQPIATARNNARAAMNFLNMQPPDMDEVREAVGCIVGDVDRAGDIIDRIGEQIKNAPPRKEQFDLNTAISEVIGLARNLTIKNGVSVQTRLADGLLPVEGDRVRLQQVVLNLILNAVEAMDSVETGARELLIGTQQDRSGVLVEVRDSGPGIDPQHLERVFQSFFTTKPGGTGMGLSVCRSIIDAHGGRLWADANEPRGAVFWFTLPGKLDAGV